MAVRKPFFVVPSALSAMSTGNALTGHSAANLGYFDAIGMTWKTLDNADIWVRGQLSSPSRINFCSIVAANALPETKMRLRLGSSLEEVDGDEAAFDSGIVDFISPAITSTDGLYHSHLELEAVQTATYYRLDISDHVGQFEAAALILGEKIEPSRFYNYNFEYGVKATGDSKITVNGVVDSQPGINLRTIDFALGWQSETEVFERFMPMLQRVATSEFVYLCFDPEPHAYRQAKTFLGNLQKPGFARGIRKPGVFLQEFSLQSVI
ncbi:hypothetical protein GRI39_01890 [Altererythrobacter indicus]|uniref:Uncharacterized protein n=1 Tax=Altericroceibacterium indicum TaxID=374177 RepID=A0A845A5G1_9SPHN|nr:hypothetical protein [Altericroceibacterium indicum]MXP24797.1 hypothetical protein [Altericroceibacterium indicum]